MACPSVILRAWTPVPAHLHGRRPARLVLSPQRVELGYTQSAVSSTSRRSRPTSGAAAAPPPGRADRGRGRGGYEYAGADPPRLDAARADSAARSPRPGHPRARRDAAVGRDGRARRGRGPAPTRLGAGRVRARRGPRRRRGRRRHRRDRRRHRRRRRGAGRPAARCPRRGVPVGGVWPRSRSCFAVAGGHALGGPCRGAGSIDLVHARWIDAPGHPRRRSPELASLALRRRLPLGPALRTTACDALGGLLALVEARAGPRAASRRVGSLASARPCPVVNSSLAARPPHRAARRRRAGAPGPDPRPRGERLPAVAAGPARAADSLGP